jgi:hypothetical protein
MGSTRQPHPTYPLPSPTASPLLLLPAPLLFSSGGPAAGARAGGGGSRWRSRGSRRGGARPHPPPPALPLPLPSMRRRSSSRWARPWRDLELGRRPHLRVGRAGRSVGRAVAEAEEERGGSSPRPPARASWCAGGAWRREGAAAGAVGGGMRRRLGGDDRGRIQAGRKAPWWGPRRIAEPPRSLRIWRIGGPTGFPRPPAGRPLQAAKRENSPAGGDPGILEVPVRVVLPSGQLGSGRWPWPILWYIG